MGKLRTSRSPWRFIVLLGVLACASAAMAQDGTGKIDTGDTAWVLVSTAFVLLMTPGLALFYGGMVRRKNVLGTMMQSFMAMGVLSLQWVFLGYTLAFNTAGNALIGGFAWLGLQGVGAEPSSYAPTIPHLAFMSFQMMFAVITPALIFGAVAERMRFKAFLVFMLLWATLIYDPLTHWIWGANGWLFKLGTLDFAGGMVVHVSAGITALVAALMLGKRTGYPHDSMPPHNLPLTVIGTGLLWFGWFGFNAGSALHANGVAAYALLNTNLAGATALVTWVFVEWWLHGKPTMLGAASGAIAGLATITPASGFVEPWAAVLIGLLAGSVCYWAVNMRFKLGYDDSLDAFGVHGVGGIVGTLALGLFASPLVNGKGGLFYGNPAQLGFQAIGVLTTVIFCGVGSYILLKVTGWITGGLRINKDGESEGMDLTEHGEDAYHLEEFPYGLGRAAVAVAPEAAQTQEFLLPAVERRASP